MTMERRAGDEIGKSWTNDRHEAGTTAKHQSYRLQFRAKGAWIPNSAEPLSSYVTLGK